MRVRTQLRLVAALVAAPLIPSLTGCNRAPLDAPIPPPSMVFGEDMCDECSMIISEQRYAGAIGLRNGRRIKHLLFDDIGEMFLYELPPHDDMRYFVHDLESAECLGADEAHFLRSKKLRTPMGTGVAAFAKPEERDAALARLGGEALTLATLRSGQESP